MKQLSAVILAVCAVAPAAAQARWVGAWATAMQGAYPLAASGSLTAEPFPALPGFRAHEVTMRMVVRPAIDGRALRVVFTNRYGDQPLRIGHAVVASSGLGATTSQSQELAFGGARAVTIPAGGETTSDTLARPVAGGRDLAISFHIAGASGKLTWHSLAYRVSYLTASGAGDKTTDSGAAFTHNTQGWFIVRRVDVDADAPSGVVVAFGDSITDGQGSTFGAHDRWSDAVARALAARAATGRYALLNAGIGGNGVLSNPCSACVGPLGVTRVTRDVIAQPGVTDAFVLFGSNDIYGGRTAAQVIAGLSEVVARLRGAGVRVTGSPIIPRPESLSLGYESVRREVNAWIRRPGSFDALMDFDAVLRDPADAAHIKPGLTDDGVHPNPQGQKAMADAFDLGLFPAPALSLGAPATGSGPAIRIPLACAGRPAARCRAAVRVSYGRTRLVRSVDVGRGSSALTVRRNAFKRARRVRVTILPSGPSRLLGVSRRR